MTPDEATALASDARSRLAPLGVRNVVLGRAESGEALDFALEINPRIPLAYRAIPRAISSSFALSAELRLSQPGSVVPADLRGVGGHQTAHGRSYAIGSAPGWAAAVPQPGAAALEVQSWQTDDAQMRGRDQNHGEAHFVAFMNSHRHLWTRLQSITITNHWFNPCGTCAGRLVELLQEINAARRAAGLPALPPPRLTWRDPWVNEAKRCGIYFGNASAAAAYIDSTIAGMTGWVVTPTHVSPQMMGRMYKAYGG